MSDIELAPAFLVAMPQLVDPKFRGSVVLITQHDENGSFGLVLNRPTDLRLSSLCENLEIPWGGTSDSLVRWGGPVSQDHGWLLVGENTVGSLELTEIVDGVGFTSSPEDLRNFSMKPPEHMRVYLGFSGWAPGQLAAEIAQGAWLVAPPSPSIVFDTPDVKVWERVLRDMGINPAMLASTQGIN